MKVGDEIELLVVRVNDVEGTAMCSKKRLDQAAGFEKVMSAGETGEVLTGIVTEVIKGPCGEGRSGPRHEAHRTGKQAQRP